MGRPILGLDAAGLSQEAHRMPLRNVYLQNPKLVHLSLALFPHWLVLASGGKTYSVRFPYSVRPTLAGWACPRTEGAPEGSEKALG